MTSARAFRLPKTICEGLRLMSAETGKSQTKIVISAIRLAQRQHKSKKKALEAKEKLLQGIEPNTIHQKIQVVGKKNPPIWRFLKDIFGFENRSKEIEKNEKK